MTVAVSSDSLTVLQLLLAAGALSGIGGTIVAIMKWRPDVNSAAVVQAQGTMEMMQKLIAELRSERDYHYKRANDAEVRCDALERTFKDHTDELEQQLLQARLMIRHLGHEDEPDGLKGD